MTITFVGHGYVGLVTAAVFADLGNTVWVIGHTQEKIDNLKKGILPIYEPGLEEIVKRNVSAGRLKFTLDYDPAISESKAIFLAVGTPPKEDGSADLSVVFSVAADIAKHLNDYAVIITKSTVPIGTSIKVREIIEANKPEGSDYDIASCPEFLREGQAISDTQHPDRVVIGTDSKRAQDVLVELHQPILAKTEAKHDTHLVLTNIPTAEMIKYAANAFLATKISFANAIAQLSEKVGADGVDALEAVGLDRRVGSFFLQPGAGYGGSCFPKDVKALIQIAKDNEYDFTILKDVEAVNKEATLQIIQKAKVMVGDLSGKTVGLLGLAFKPDTDDMRDAPSRIIAKQLLSFGAKVTAYDPISQENAKRLMPDLDYKTNAYEVANGSDLVILVTEWNEFKQLDLEVIKTSMKQPNFIDGRNVYEPEKMRAMGFNYKGVGR